MKNPMLQDHPIAAIFPLMPSGELQKMADDIKQHGQRQDIALYEGKILDGRNRYRACMLAGTTPKTYIYAGDDPVGEVLSLNLHRRHLTAGEKAAIAAEALPHFEEEARKRQAHGETAPGKTVVEKIPQANEGKSRDQAAAKVGVNPRYVSDAKKIKESSPETFEKLKSGEISMAAAKEEALPKPEPKLPKYTPALGLQIADNAIRMLGTITAKDSDREAGFKKVISYCNQQLKK